MNEIIYKGMTFKSIPSFIGLAITVCGLLLLIFGEQLLLSIGITLIGFIIFLAIEGVIIDYDKKRIKPYLDLLLFKTGFWKDLDNYNKIILDYLNESQSIKIDNKEISHSKSFDIYLVSNSGRKIILKEFIYYENAKNFLDKYAEKLNKEKLNTYEVTLNNSK